MKVLLVEDDAGIRELLSTVFKRVGIEFDVAFDGGTALKKLRANRYDILVLDIDRSQVYALLRKPFDLETLLATVTQCAGPAQDARGNPRRSYSLRTMRE